MKLKYLYILFLWCIFQGAFSQVREYIPVSGEWKFNKGIVKSNTPDDTSWKNVSIPHTWNKDDGMGNEKREYYRGAGVYSKVIYIPQELRDKRLFLRFEAVSSSAEIYLNGKFIGSHDGAFNAFCFEITKSVQTGSNQLVVKATNEWNEQIAPLAGDFTMFGGIYRPVWLIALNQICITPLDYASPGVYVRQTEVKKEYAKLDITTKINNYSSKDQQVKVRLNLLDKAGKLIGTANKTIEVPQEKTISVLQQMSVEHPVLWNGRINPYMYRLLVEVMQGNQLTDSISQNIGLRYYEIDPEKGFFLNGSPYNIRGVNRHQDREGMGWAITNAEHDEDMELIKDMGANGIRLAHYPHSGYFYSLCDKAGMFVWAEIPLIEKTTKSPAFEENIKMQLVEMIRQNYNHPSIFCWSLFNELSKGEPEDIVRELNELAHKEDSSRFTTAAPNIEKRPENSIPDFIAFNTYPGWYWANPDAMGGALKNWNNLGGNKGICGSEYGAGASIHQHEQRMIQAPKTDGQWHPEEWQSIVHESNYKHIKNSDFVWASFVWNMFDFAVASRNEGDRPGINDKGLLTYDRKVRKDAFYYYKANWSDEPVIHITSKRHSDRKEAVTDVKVYANTKELNLKVNGKDMGNAIGDNCVYVWKSVRLEPGKNIISVSGKKDGLLVSDECEWNLEKALVDYVNPYIGTALKGEGGTAPFVGTPFAMTSFLPQTRENKMGTMAYVYDDTYMMGFLASHQPTVWMGDYGYVSVMPQIGELQVLPEQRKLKFEHKNEQATPYYYSVSMQTANGKSIQGEMTASSRCALLRFTFPESEQSHLIVQGINLNAQLSDWCNDYTDRLKNLLGWVKIDTVKNEIIGYNPDRQSAQLGPELPNFKGYFVIQFDRPIKNYGTWGGVTIFKDSLEQEGRRMGAYISFSTTNNERVKVRIATSFIGIEQAKANLSIEIPDWDFEKLKADTKQQWENKLSKLQVTSDNEDEKTIFYTALYHCYLFPREFSEYGRYYSAFDDKVHDGFSYNDYSLWDTFRAFHPLMSFLEPELTGNWITSLLQMYKEGGWMPMWPNPTYTNIMIATHADAVISDSYMKGIRNYDVNLAYEAMMKDATVPPDFDTSRRYGDRDRWTSFEARAGLTYYHSIGYVPDDKTAESVSRTLEYAFDDWCIAQVAKDMGKMSDYEQLMQWSRNYRNIYNKNLGFMLPRKYNGDWINIDDYSHQGLTEGSKWTYLFCVLQDIPGMIEMMGGNDSFSRKLDMNFNQNFYKHDNEPGHHYIYLYDYCGQPWKTQELARKHTQINYKNAPDGVNGNDDCGQMSAWYLFSVMGFYPVTPASNEFAIGAPQFPEINMKLQISGQEKNLKIKANHLSEENLYVQAVYLDGKKLDKAFVNYFDLINADEIVFEMGKAKVLGEIHTSANNVNLYVSQGKIHFTSVAGDMIEVYNLLGQKVIRKNITAGLNAIDTPQNNGIFLVKVDNNPVEKVTVK